jgi:hypothetical protein
LFPIFYFHFFSILFIFYFIYVEGDMNTTLCRAAPGVVAPFGPVVPKAFVSVESNERAEARRESTPPFTCKWFC